MPDIIIKKVGRAGWITLNRPKALNALTYDMILKIENALEEWREDHSVSLVLFDSAGNRAFCSGGDIADLYAEGRKGNYGFGQKFWKDEYRVNAKIYEYTKPIVSFLHGFTMGGGVGIGCHASHRIVCENTQIAMPECGIGLMPDVGGSLILSNAPDGLGIYLGTTCKRMGPEDAIYAGFADTFIPQDNWNNLKTILSETGNWKRIIDYSAKTSESFLKINASKIKKYFMKNSIFEINSALKNDENEFTKESLSYLNRSSPLSVACTVKVINLLKNSNSIRDALNIEYRFTYRATQYGDFLEGIRAQIIEKDKKPKWKNKSLEDVSIENIDFMLESLKENELNLEKVLK
ncbi:enoyl-CoA hydratase/isomerase family protein [Paracoccaceae bacterium]|nr:enoyl-CoA hydratase/isomerase family protein [Paracoccaceae bacterium]